MNIVCLNCGSPYPDIGAPYQCPKCGGLYDFVDLPIVGKVNTVKPGIWRYVSWLDERQTLVSLGEGNTPLISGNAFGRELFFKCEYANPSGSFKDRGSSVLVTFLKTRGVAEAVEDSSGNAGASFAAYAARAGIKARVYVPQVASGPKRQQIEIYGAELVVVPGSRSQTTQAALKAAEAGMVYASHAYSPFNLAGYATCAFEIVEQLGRAPGAVVIPAGQGGLLLGLSRGFLSLLRADKIKKMPSMIGVQASSCAPLAEIFTLGADGKNFVKQPSDTAGGSQPTLAEGVNVRTPLRAEAVVKTTRETGGRFITVDEEYILPGRDALARMGFYVEPTSALVWQALNETISELSDPVVAILTGSGYKVRL
jgi:threonine synthase